MSDVKNDFFEEWAEPMIFAGLALVCLLIYGQAIRFDFINLDDHSYVYQNPAVLSGINGDSIRWAFTAFHSSNWHPLTWLSHALDVQLFGLNPGTHHAVNVILHLANSCLAFVVFRKYTGMLWQSALIAFLFAAHPTHVESVAWISERKDVLSTLFWLLTMLSYASFAMSAAATGPVLKRMMSPYFLLAILLLALGLLSKPMLVTLPFVLLLLDLWPLKRIAKVRDMIPLFVEKLPMFALVAASGLITYIAQKESGAVLALERLPLDERVANAVLSYAKYIGTMFYPANLGIWYPFDPEVGIAAPAAAAIVLIGISALAVWQIRSRPYIAVGWFWFLGTLVPVIGLVQVGAQAMADRYTYIPYFGLFVIVVWGGTELAERFNIDRRVAAAVCVVAIGALTISANAQAAYWKNSETLYTRTISVTEENYFLMNLLCRHYIDRTPAEHAERRCTELLDHTSNYMEAHNTIGLLRVELGRYDDAIVSYKKALQIQPRAGIVHLNTAVAYAKKGDTEQAEKLLLRAQELPDRTVGGEPYAYAYNILGETYAAKNDVAAARKSFETALRLQPKMKEASDNLTKLQGAQGK